MKQFLNLFIVSAITFVMATSAIAQTAGPKGQGGQPGGPGKGGDGPRGGMRGGGIKMFADKLNLTADQKAKLAKLDEAMKAEFGKMRSSNLPQEQKREKMRSMMKSHMEKVQAILTKEQKAKLEQLMKEARAKRGDKGAPGAKAGKGGKGGKGGAPKP
ncbi:MAG: hypothetical protein JNJ45_03945 [Chthonomonas sp.]|nr:hypothetical protein [Chthonomonas sp.]